MTPKSKRSTLLIFYSLNSDRRSREPFECMKGCCRSQGIAHKQVRNTQANKEKGRKGEHGQAQTAKFGPKGM